MQQILKAAFALLLLDSGVVIAIQLFSYCLGYFCGGNIAEVNSAETVTRFYQQQLLISMINIVNVGAIIFRLYCLAKGINHDLVTCYWQAIKRWPALVMLYFLSGFLILGLLLPFFKLYIGLGTTLDSKLLSLIINSCIALLIFLIFSLQPYLLGVFVVALEQGPMKSFLSLYNYIRNDIDGITMCSISLMYAFGILINYLVPISSSMWPIVSGITSMWFLFCHTVVMAAYFRTAIPVKLPNTEVAV